ncbi:uncharacterized protein LOC113350850 [Papaver somniferum]|uniref:uncharacterized protein LOC113350850 n=1 Tax=Papaver somniferum TaxID=3469 RepID=UPI000E6FA9B0|nr:uncharacterized protein LOC113350850 [Papaver somniferum]
MTGKDWEVVHPQVLQQALARPCSDHNLIALNCQCLKHGSVGYIFCKKLQLLKIKLKEWSKAEYDSRLRSGKPCILCKIDFEKAFDHVNWDFLDEIFMLMGFGEKGGDGATSFFISKKGIRQGDPISAFLFLLVGEALNFMIKRAQKQGMISGFQVKPNGLVISHLKFADDTLIFIDEEVEHVKILIILLISFEMLTGLKINFAKSQIYGVGFAGDLAVFSSILGCYSGCLPTTYLGLPLGDRCGGVAKWDKIIEKFILKLPGWEKTHSFKSWKDNSH